MNRRSLLASIASLSLTSAGHAQVGTQQRSIAFTSGGTSRVGRTYVHCFLDELAVLGWREGQNLKVEYRFGENVQGGSFRVVKEADALGVDVVIVSGTNTAQAALQEIKTKPVVFVAVSDPVASGVVKSLSQPGGNITGVSNFLPATTGKLLELLRSIAPSASRIAVFRNPVNPGKLMEQKELEQVAPSLGMSIRPVDLRVPADIEVALQTVRQEKLSAIVGLAEYTLLEGREAISDFALSERIPALFQLREFAEAGALISFGLNYCQHHKRAAIYVDKLLRGASPRDLPVELPARYEMVVNLKTAAAIGLTIPPTLLAAADDVID